MKIQRTASGEGLRRGSAPASATIRRPNRRAGRLPVAVPCVSFCRSDALMAELQERYPNVKLNSAGESYLEEDKLIEYLRGCRAAIVSPEPITERVLRALPELEVVSKWGVGLDNVDPAAMRRHGVRLGWRAGVNRRAVAELALTLMLMSLRRVLPLNLAMRAARHPAKRLGRQLSGRIVGIHGCGNIGRELVRLLQPFDVSLIACDLIENRRFNRQYRVQQVDFGELLEQSELLSIHLPLTVRTRGLYTAAVLDRLAPGCVLINTARGEIVDEFALRERLEDGRLSAAGFDVFATEPPVDDALLRLSNFVATPHIGAATAESWWQMGMAAIDGLEHNFLPEPGTAPFEH